MALLSKINSKGVQRAVIWSVCAQTQKTQNSWGKHTYTYLKFCLWATHFSSSMRHPGSQNTTAKNEHYNRHGNTLISLWIRERGNISGMRGTKRLPCSGRQIPGMTAVVMVQSHDQSCSSFQWDKLIVIVCPCFHFTCGRKHTHKYRNLILLAMSCDLHKSITSQTLKTLNHRTPSDKALNDHLCIHLCQFLTYKHNKLLDLHLFLEKGKDKAYLLV